MSTSEMKARALYGLYLDAFKRQRVGVDGWEEIEESEREVWRDLASDWASERPMDFGLNAFRDACHTAAVEAGWHKNRREVGTMLALIHSEISEALEGDRKDLMDDKLPHRKMIEVELADAMIRIGDLAGMLGLDIGGAVVEKMAYNRVRQDHKEETRQLDGGKAY